MSPSAAWPLTNFAKLLKGITPPPMPASNGTSSSSQLSSGKQSRKRKRRPDGEPSQGTELKPAEAAQKRPKVLHKLPSQDGVQDFTARAQAVDSSTNGVAQPIRKSLLPQNILKHIAKPVLNNATDSTTGRGRKGATGKAASRPAPGTQTARPSAPPPVSAEPVTSVRLDGLAPSAHKRKRTAAPQTTDPAAVSASPSPLCPRARLEKKIATGLGASRATSSSTEVPPKHKRTTLNEAAQRQAQDKVEQVKRDKQQKDLGEEVPLEERLRYVALDCEMVGVGPSGRRSALARACLVDWDGKIIYDKHVKPNEHVTDYRTFVSGIRPKDLKNGVPTKLCKMEVSVLLQGKVLVGHALHNDLKALSLSHPANMIRDTATFAPYKLVPPNGLGGLRPRSLKILSDEFLQMKIQSGEHHPAEDARAAMLLYRLKRREWEKSARARQKLERLKRPVNQVKKSMRVVQTISVST